MSKYSLDEIRASTAVSWPKRLVTSVSPHRPRLDSRPVHVKFVVDEVALGQVFFSGTSDFPR
jgi:hypothetical protein